MKKLILTAVLGALSLTAMAQGDGETVTISAAAQKANLAGGVRSMSSDEFNRFAGSYELSNGQSIALFSKGLKKYAMVHGEAWHEVVATSAHSFVARDKMLAMTIDRHDDGTLSGEVLLATDPEMAVNGDAFERVAIVTPR